MTILKGGLLLAGACLCAFLYWRMSALNGEKALLEAELEQARLECQAWKVTAEAYRTELAAQADNAARCLAREAQASRDAAERKNILKQAKPRARTAQEKMEVVDEETRSRAVERLNRPL